ncbi:MAG: class E sortase [Firmicutes bacterium]|nr:class E sortase [Bacillota bacterium]
MKRVTRHIGLILIVVGVLLAALPLYRWATSVYYQRLAMNAFEESIPENPAPSDLKTPVEIEAEPAKEELPTALGLLEIDKIDLKAAVIHGITEDDLKKGPGFYPQSKHPEIGNVSIAAHRGVYGSWFRHLDRLKPGDKIFLTLGTNRYQYKVREQFVTHSRDWSVIDSMEIAELTLTTCLYTTTSKRLILKADLVDVINTPVVHPKTIE